jgi:hypothetical protein
MLKNIYMFANFFKEIISLHRRQLLLFFAALVLVPRRGDSEAKQDDGSLGTTKSG